jgi:hypothetical protein
LKGKVSAGTVYVLTPEPERERERENYDESGG